MFYFTHTVITQFEAASVEKAVRRFSAKRYTSLDLSPSSSLIQEEKYFLGLENNDTLSITRIRTPFERLIPKIVLSFKKEAHFKTYRTRLSLFTFIAFIFIALGFADSLYYAVADYSFDAGLISSTLLLAGFAGLVLLEMKITGMKLNKAVSRTIEAETVMTAAET